MHKEAESVYSQMVIDLLRLSSTALLMTKAWVMQHCSSSGSAVTPVWRNTKPMEAEAAQLDLL